ncbi:recombination protein RecR [Helicobacter enhydrae]|uniref:Recombination protein RecR n=1 Tax=Helicobacter enhydrae TaxID=222136 RepID=A0A1B1U5B5_9HELI|nr:recombination mediator RecR [Helicobacter enhydrae]ANV97921.1 recombination protein RecR [Helicobacter enhydrae]
MIKYRLETFQTLVETLEQIPTIGRKTAEKIAYTLSVEDKKLAQSIASAIMGAANHIRKCQTCQGLSENEECGICIDTERDNGELCIVQHARDIGIVESVGFFKGKYFVLENLDEVDFEKLQRRIQDCGICEVIFSFPPSLSNDALMLFVEDRLSACQLSFSKIAQGIPTGIALDHIDHLSLMRAFQGRIKI